MSEWRSSDSTLCVDFTAFLPMGQCSDAVRSLLSLVDVIIRLGLGQTERPRLKRNKVVEFFIHGGSFEMTSSLFIDCKPLAV